MTDELKKKVAEFAKIASTCPEKLQEKCFEVLLSYYLSAQQPEGRRGKADVVTSTPVKELPGTHPEQRDIEEKDIHVKAKKFLKTNGLTLKEINQIFYKEGDEFRPLYDTLKSTKVSESQIHLALLQALKSGLKHGKFEFDGELVRQDCVTMKCYDAANFTAYFKGNAKLFDRFKKYMKRNPKVVLSTEGRKRLAELITEMQ